jgi:DNA-binding response OmpR family regulator
MSGNANDHPVGALSFRELERPAAAPLGTDEGDHGLLAYPLERGPRVHKVLVYSSEAGVRDAVRTAVGRHPAPDLGRIEWVEATTGPKAIEALDAGGLDLVIVDGEARPTGGLGLAKQFKDEIADCPPFVALIARPGDAWLATWSLADAVLPLPIDAPALTAVVAEQLRHRESGVPVRRALA